MFNQMFYSVLKYKYYRSWSPAKFLAVFPVSTMQNRKYFDNKQKQAGAEVVQSSCSVQVIFRFSLVKIRTVLVYLKS